MKLKKICKNIAVGVLSLTMVLSLMTGVGAVQVKADDGSTTTTDDYNYIGEIKGIRVMQSMVAEFIKNDQMPRVYYKYINGIYYQKNNIYALNSNSENSDLTREDVKEGDDASYGDVDVAVQALNEALQKIPELTGKKLVWRIFFQNSPNSSGSGYILSYDELREITNSQVETAEINYFLAIEDDNGTTASHTLAYYTAKTISNSHWACGLAKIHVGSADVTKSDLYVSGDSEFHKTNKKAMYIQNATVCCYGVNNESNTELGTPITCEYNANSTYTLKCEDFAESGWKFNKATTDPEDRLSDFAITTEDNVLFTITPQKIFTEDSSITLKLEYTPALNTVEYNSNTTDKANYPDSEKKVTFNDTYTVLGNGTVGFTNPGYTFKEWNTEANGTGTTYAEGSQITGIAKDTTLYAIWEKNIVIIPGDNTDDDIIDNTGDDTGDDTGDTTGDTDDDTDDNTDIDDGDTPLTPGTGDTDNGNTNNGTTTGGTTIHNGSTPLAGDADVTNQSSNQTAPKTGDAGALPWLALSGVAGLGLAAIFITGKKRK